LKEGTLPAADDGWRCSNPARNQGRSGPATLGSDRPHRLEGSKIRSPRGETGLAPQVAAKTSILKADKLQPVAADVRSNGHAKQRGGDGRLREDASGFGSSWLAIWHGGKE